MVTDTLKEVTAVSPAVVNQLFVTGIVKLPVLVDAAYSVVLPYFT